MKGKSLRIDQITRRQLAALSAGALASLSAAGSAQPASAQNMPGDADHQAAMRRLPVLRFGLVMFPKMTALDLIAPELLMATMMATEVHLVSSTMNPVMSDSNVAIVPTRTYEACPADLDVLFVPGGPKGTAVALQDDVLLNFLADRGAKTRYVTSVCTGSVILGAAGLLKGYRAASHWGTREMLSMFGATPVDERVVIDRNRLTGGGLTAGLDFGLVLSKTLHGEETARLQELILEYDPQPPFNSGNLQNARPETAALARKVLARDLDGIRTAAAQTQIRRGG